MALNLADIVKTSQVKDTSTSNARVRPEPDPSGTCLNLAGMVSNNRKKICRLGPPHGHPSSIET